MHRHRSEIHLEKNQSKFCSADPCFIRYGKHYGTDRKAIKVIINKNQAAKKHGGKHGRLPRFNLFLCPISENTGASRLIQKLYHHT